MTSWSPLSLCWCWLSIVRKVARVPGIVPECNLSAVVWVVVWLSVEQETVPTVAIVASQNVVLYGWSSRRLAVPAFGSIMSLSPVVLVIFGLLVLDRLHILYPLPFTNHHGMSWNGAVAAYLLYRLRRGCSLTVLGDQTLR